MLAPEATLAVLHELYGLVGTIRTMRPSDLSNPRQINLYMQLVMNGYSAAAQVEIELAEIQKELGRYYEQLDEAKERLN